MSVFREIEIAWGGASYTVTPTNALVRRIEGEVSLAKLAERCDRGDVPVSELAYVGATLLASAGAEVTEDEMYAELCHAEPEAAVAFCGLILAAVSPSVPSAKKLGAALGTAGTAAPGKKPAGRKKSSR